MNLLRVSMKLLRRDWRAGEWRALLLALMLAVGSLATVGLFADRVRQALQQQAQSLIGADLRLSSTRPLAPDYRRLAERHGLQTVQSRSFPSMVTHGEQVVLAEIQAVEPGYPLRGALEIDDGRKRVADGIPAPGTVWIDARLLRRLDVRLGDELTIGSKRFRVSATVLKDIDQAIGFSSFAPRVLLNDADLVETGLLQEGSRIIYRLLFAGATEQVRRYRMEIELRLSGNEKLEDVRDARPEIRTSLERAEHFLNLAALTAAILAGVALALAARRFVARHLDGCAVMRCLGAQQWQLLWLFLVQFILLGLAGVVLGTLLGYAVQAALVQSMEAMRNADLPQPGGLPLLKAALSGMSLLLGFAFLPLLQLRRVSPLRVLRRELGLPPASNWLIYGLALTVLAGLFLWHAGSVKLGLMVLIGLLLGLMLFGWLAWLLLYGLVRNSSLLQAHWRHALNNLVRHGRNAAVQVVALSLGGMALLVLTLVRGDLLSGWQSKLPPDAPNRFLVNVQPDQLAAVQEFFARHALPIPEFQPMVRARLVAINDRPVRGEDYDEPRARALVEREFNLSYLAQMPVWNETVQGEWWDQQDQARLSVEEGIAKTLGIRLGDTLTYDVAGSLFTARIAHLRKVQWDSMRVNFFVITSPDVLRDYPASYLSSFYLPSQQARMGDELVQRFPNVLLIDTGAVIRQVRDIMDQIAHAVSTVFLFTMLAGLVVLYAALLATQDERLHEAAILRTLGADSAYLQRLHLSEFAILGLQSGLFAAGGAMLLGWGLARSVFDIPYQVSFSLWLAGASGGILIVTVSGWLATRRMLRLPPLRILIGE